MKGGARQGAGRPKGAINKKTAELTARVEAAGITPLDFMLNLMRNEQADMAERFEAAKAAAPYVHAKLQTTTLQGPDGGPVETLQRIERHVVDPANPDS